MKKIVCLILMGMMLCGCMISCQKNGSEDTSTSVYTEAPDQEEHDNVPAMNLDGFEFTILCRSTDVLYQEITAETSSGDQVDIAVYNRNEAVKSRFNCKLNVTGVSESPARTLMETFRKSVISGASEYHLCLDHMMYTASESLNGTMYNWNDLTHVDLSRPWWHQSLINEASFGDKLMYCASDYCLSSTYFTWLMIFNTVMCREHNIDVYEMVENGTWTIDNFIALVNTLYQDDNGDSIQDVNDIYGFTTHYNTAVTNWMFALNIPVLKVNDDATYEIKLNSDRMINAVEKVYRLLFESTNGTLYLNAKRLGEYGIKDHDQAVTSIFANKKTVFAATRIFALENLRSSDTEYGIVPYPKYDEEQSEYYSHVDGRASMMFIPYNLPDSIEEKVSAIVEVLSFYSYRDVMPVIENVALLGRYSTDSQAYQMLQKTLAGRTYAFAYLHRDNTGKLYWMLSDMMAEDNYNFVSEWKKKERSAQRSVDALIEKLKDLE